MSSLVQKPRISDQRKPIAITPKCIQEIHFVHNWRQTNHIRFVLVKAPP